MTTGHEVATFVELIDLAYAGVSNPEDWRVFLERLTTVTDGDRAVVHNHWDLGGDSGGVIAIGMDAAAMQAYRDHYWAVTPWRDPHKPRRRRVGQVTYPHRHENVPGSEFFHDWMRPWRIFDDACVTLDTPDGRPLPGMSVGLTDPHRRFTSEDERLLKALVPHVSRALHLTRAFQKQRILGEHAAYDASGVGIVELSPTIGVVDANETARRLLRLDTQKDRERAPITQPRVSSSGLKFSNRDTQAAFESAVVDARSPRMGSHQRPWFRISRRGQHALAAFVTAEAHGWFTDRELRLYVLDPHNGEATPIETWRVLWGLTPAEGRVALELLHGRTPQEIAANTRVSVHAVRFHIKSMLAKTATRRQTELMLLLSRTAHVNPR